jgi:biopolymer transport protein ExbD
MKRLPTRAPKIEMDVSFAIVNIVFLLLFFFLIIGQSPNTQTEGIELAETSELPLDRLPSPILVVTAQGAWELDGTAIAPELLAVAMQNMPRPLVLHVLINRSAPADSLLQIVTRPDLAEVDLRLVTLKTKEGLAP